MRAAVKRSLIAGVTIGSVGLGAAALVPAFAGPEEVKVVTASGKTGVPGQYIVTLRNSAAAQTSQTMAKRFRAADRYDSALKGFVAKLTAAQLKTLQDDPNVVAIEQDRIMKATALPSDPKVGSSAALAGEEPIIKGSAIQSSAPWGLDRIDEHDLPLTGKYVYKRSGTGTNVYVIDTGIMVNHSQFGTRASVAADFVGDGRNGADCNGHGTHVAGIVGGSKYGVAKGTKLHAVRVLDCNGEGYLSDIITGIDWVKANHAKASVANISLGGEKSTAFNSALTSLSNSGVFVVVSAGNGDENGRALNACTTSPASAGWVEAVGATTAKDYKTTWSNYGKCVDITAPGSYIPSAWIGSTTATKSISGTSMAAPHVAGVAALYKNYYPNSNFSAVQKWLHNAATKNHVKNIGSGTPNRLLYKAGL